MRILIIGGGSIGQRHLRNLTGLGMRDIVLVETDKQRRAQLKDNKYLKVYGDLNLVAKERFDGALVCTPPNSHLGIAWKLIRSNIHSLFIEKPLSHTLKGVNEFISEVENRKIQVLVGYNLRFHPGLTLVKKLLKEKRIGKVLSVRIEAGQYLPDWRPQQDYRKSYTAKKKLGGGIILDGSHEIDYLFWLLGDIRPVEIFCFAGKLSPLEVETEDTAEILLKFSSGLIANIHLDFIQRTYFRSGKFIGEKGTIIWDYPSNQVKLYTIKKGEWQIFKLKFNPNDMYLEEMKHFLKVIQGKDKPRVDVKEGRDVLTMALLAKKSAFQGKKILIK